MKARKPELKRATRAAAVAVTGLLAIVISACTVSPATSNSTSSGGNAPGADVVTVANTGELCSLNPNSDSCQLLVNRQVAYLTTGMFSYVDNSAKIVDDKSFGTVQVLSKDPLTIKYTVNKGITWSDGVQVGADDMLLETLARTQYYDDVSVDGKTGTKYFNHSQSSAGMRLAGFPQVGDDGRSMTITYATPYADWQLFNPVNVPAHVVAKETGVAAAGQPFIDLLKSIPRGDLAHPRPANAKLQKIANFWNTGFNTKSMPTDPQLTVSSGPYKIASWATGQSVTLEKSPTYKGGLKPTYQKVVVRFIADSTAQVQALNNGEVDIIQPQASADTLSGLKAIPGAQILQGTSGSWDLMQLNFNSPVFSDPVVREAFLKTIPRQQLMNAIVLPLDPKSPMIDSLIFLPGQPGYDQAVKANGSSAFDQTDVDGAKKLLNGRKPKIRLVYNRDNPNRLDSFQAIQASAAQAGFQIVDGGLSASQWISVLPQNSKWDAFIWGTTSEGVGVTHISQYYLSSSQASFGRWKNADADKKISQILTTIDPAAQHNLAIQIDADAWHDYWGLPLYSNVGIQAADSKVAGVVYNPWTIGVVWNFWQWKPAG